MVAIATAGGNGCSLRLGSGASGGCCPSCHRRQERVRKDLKRSQATADCESEGQSSAGGLRVSLLGHRCGPATTWRVCAPCGPRWLATLSARSTPRWPSSCDGRAALPPPRPEAPAAAWNHKPSVREDHSSAGVSCAQIHQPAAAADRSLTNRRAQAAAACWRGPLTAADRPCATRGSSRQSRPRRMAACPYSPPTLPPAGHHRYPPLRL